MVRTFDITQLPPELLNIIVDLLDSPSYVEEHLEDDPAETFDMKGKQIASDARMHLKNASSVSRQWNRIFRPMIFRHIFVRLRLLSLTYLPANTDDPCAGVINFVRVNQEFLKNVVQTVTLFLLPGVTGDFYSGQRLMDVDNGRILIDLEACVSENGRHPYQQPRALIYDPFSKIWASLTSITPKRLTLVGPDVHMAVYLPGHCNYQRVLGDDDLARLRVISVYRSCDWDDTIGEHFHQPQRPSPAQKLLTLCRWTDVLLNEGLQLRDWRGRGDPGYETSESRYGISDLSLQAALRKCKEEEEVFEFCFSSTGDCFFDSVTYICDFGCYTDFEKVSLWGTWFGLFDANLTRVRTLPPHFNLQEFLSTPMAWHVGRNKVREHYDKRFTVSEFAVDFWSNLADKFHVFYNEERGAVDFLDFKSMPGLWKTFARMVSDTGQVEVHDDRPGHVTIHQTSD